VETRGFIYRNSGDVTGEKSALLVIQVLLFMLNEEERKILLDLARFP
jgi:hypothetical protein